MPNLNKIKKRVRAVRKDFEENNYYKAPPAPYNPLDDYTEKDLELLKYMKGMIERKHLKEPVGFSLTFTNIAIANRTTVEGLLDRVFEYMATEEVKKEYKELGLI